jgi:hypothetical protein
LVTVTEYRLYVARRIAHVLVTFCSISIGDDAAWWP